MEEFSWDLRWLVQPTQGCHLYQTRSDDNFMNVSNPKEINGVKELHYMY